MLPKPEKPTKKSAKGPEQLDLVKTLDEGSQSAARRLWVIILLFSTIGLSIIFSLYRYTQYLIAHPPQISVPQVSLSKPDLTLPDTLDSSINTTLGSAPWSIKVFVADNSDYRLLWSKNPDALTFEPAALVKTLAKAPLYPDSVIANTLPQGLNYHELVVTTATTSQHQLLIDLPKRQILIVSQLNNADLSQFKTTLPKLVDLLYWYAVKN